MPGSCTSHSKGDGGRDYFSMLHIESGITFSLGPDTPAPASRQSGVTFLLEMKHAAKPAPVRGYFFPLNEAVPPHRPQRSQSGVTFLWPAATECGRKATGGIREGLCTPLTVK